MTLKIDCKYAMLIDVHCIFEHCALFCHSYLKKSTVKKCTASERAIYYEKPANIPTRLWE